MFRGLEVGGFGGLEVWADRDSGFRDQFGKGLRSSPEALPVPEGRSIVARLPPTIRMRNYTLLNYTAPISKARICLD